MTTKDSLVELFERIDATYWGPEERQMTAEAVALAVELGDEELEYRARMRQTASAFQSGDTDTLLSSFAWCLAKHDADPERFPRDIENGSADLMWHFKWMGGVLSRSPQFAREQIAAVLDDMESHYRAEGLGPSGVLTARFEEAWMDGRTEEAEQWRLQLEATERDSHPHCEACGPSQQTGFFAETGREADAIRLVGEMIEGGFQCGEEPEHALSRVMIAHLRAGQFDDARHAHQRSYRLAKDNADNLKIIANHLLFLAVTGNEARGLALLERHIGWLTHDPLNQRGQFDALVAFAVLLDSVTRAGHGDQLVRGADAPELESFFGPHGGVWTAAELATASWGAAITLGDAFDARNGTSRFSDQITEARALAGEHYDLPISTDGFRPQVSPLQPVDAAERFVRACDLAEWGAPLEGVAAARRAAESADELTVTQQRRLASSLIGGLVALGDDAGAEVELPRRLELLRAEGLDAQADLEARYRLALFGRATDDDLAAMEAELESGADLPAASRADLELTLAFAALSSEGDPELVTARCARAADLFRPGGRPARPQCRADGDAVGRDVDGRPRNGYRGHRSVARD